MSLPSINPGHVDYDAIGNTRNGSNGHLEERATDEITSRRDSAGDGLLDEVLAIQQRHVAFPTPHHAVAVVCWIAHCHLLEAFDTTPRLAVLSPEKGSGKTRVLEVAEPLLPDADLLLTPSASVLFRLIDAAEGTYCVLLDECDAFLAPKNLSTDMEQVRALVNSGYRRGASIPRTEVSGKSFTPVRFSVFAPVALAGIGDLPDTILDRSVVIPMKRRRSDERVIPWRERMKAGLVPLRDRLTEWGSGQVAAATELDSDLHFLPDWCEDRTADVWGPLIVTAAVAGPKWHQMMVDAAEFLLEQNSTRSASLGVRLLADVRTVFATNGVDQMATTELLKALHDLEDAPWGDLRGEPIAPRFLARKLGDYDVRPRLLNMGGEERVRGYSMRDDTNGSGGLGDAWSRYLPSIPGESVTSVTDVPNTTAVTDVTPVTAPVGDDAEVRSLFATEAAATSEEDDQ